MVPRLVRRALLLVTIMLATGAIARPQGAATAGFFIGGHVVLSPGFEHRHRPGTYSGEGFSHTIAPSDAKIGTTTFQGGLRGVGGWGFNRFVAWQAGFDILGGGMKLADGTSEGSSQMSIFTGLRLNLPVGRDVIPYAFVNYGGISLTSKGDVDLICGTMSGCHSAGSDWDGPYVGVGGGLEVGRKLAENGHFAFDIHVESIRATLDCDFGAGEKCEPITPLRLSAGFVWRLPKR
jgi:hypothetical protein